MNSQSQSFWSIERVVVLLTPLFAAAAAWLCTFVANNVPGAPALDRSGVEGLEIAVFLGVVSLVIKWLHGRQKLLPNVTQVLAPATAVAPNEGRIRELAREEVHALLRAIAKAAAAAPPPGPPGT